MKYNHLKGSYEKCFKLPELDGGLDLNGVKKNCPKECTNMWYNSGRLKTRPGLEAKGENAIIIAKQSYFDEFDYKLHDIKINYLDTEYRIGTVGVNSDDYDYTLYIYFIASGFNVLKVGKMDFLRVSANVFKVPENIIFYTGKPQNGGGIFALVTLVNVEDKNDKNYNVYEINSEFTDWERVYEFYVPTLLINGRGNNYDIAVTEKSINLPEPRAIESQNLLDGKFHAYYTSDGYSNMFRLPVTNLSYSAVLCRIYYSTGLYTEWKVSGQSIVDTQKFMGVDVMLTVDHAKGTLSFTLNGEPYAIPAMRSFVENNIKITATKELPNTFAQVVDSSCSLAADGRVYLSGGLNGNILMLAKTENPLYFPHTAAVDIGGIEPVTALSIQNKKIIAFKESECYFLSLRKGKRINEMGLIADNDKLFKEADSLSVELISKSVGCKYKNTVCRVRDKTVWLGQDREVYLLNGIGFDSVEIISDSLKLKENYEYTDSFAVSDGNNYILSAQNKAVVCDLTHFSSPKWYDWNFGGSSILAGAFYRNGLIWFWCNAENNGISYVAPLNGENDVQMYYDEDGDIQVEKVAIDSFLLTKPYVLDGQNHKNVIESINIAVSGKGKVKFKVNNRNIATINLRFSTDDYDKGEYKTVVIRPHLYDTERVQLYVESDSEFSIGDIEIFYRKTG